MLDSRVCTLPAPLSLSARAVGSMSLLGPDYPFLERLDRGGAGVCLGVGVGVPHPECRPVFPVPWRPSLWRTSFLLPPPPPPPIPPPPPLFLPPPHHSSMCPESCHVPALSGTGVTHLLDYVDSPPRWCPWYRKGDDGLLAGCRNGLEGNLDAGAGGPGAESALSGGLKELPSRSLKTDRVKDRQELGHILSMDKEHLLSLQQARKTATISTQTQYSSFKGEAPPYPGPPPGPPPAYFAPHDTTYPSMPNNYRPPRTLPPTPYPSSASKHLVDLSRLAQENSSDVQNAPLNLSLSSGSNGVSSASAVERQAARPSVITCLSSSSSSPLSSSRESSPRCHVNGSGSGSHNGRGSPCGSNSAVSDPVIEEHFRRSLGRSYEDSIPNSAPSASPTDPNLVSVTESVDDHFAKALGDSTWKAIKSQNDPSQDVFTGTVDDHFAKALGATTWLRIKAETEHSENINNNNSNGYSPSRPAATSPPNSSLSATVVS